MVSIILAAIINSFTPSPLPVLPKPLPPVVSIMFARGEGVYDDPSPPFLSFVREPKNYFLIGNTMYLWVDGNGVYHVTVQISSIPPGVSYTAL